MFRRIYAIEDYRGLSPELMPDESVSFGKRTIIYGANGMGKSTISEFLRTIADPGAPCKFRSDGHVLGSTTTRWSPGDTSSNTEVRVFNHFYIENQLKGFLEADGQSETIFKLGDNADAAAGEEVAKNSAKRYGNWKSAVEEQIVLEAGSIADAEQLLKSNVNNTLSIVDKERFSTYRFNISAARDLLRKPQLSALNVTSFAEMMAMATMSTPALVKEIPALKDSIEDLHVEVENKLQQETNAIVLEALVKNPTLAQWVSTGLSLHEADGECHFCLGTVSADRFDALQKHFDDSSARVASELRALVDRCDFHVQSLSSWRRSAPRSTDFYPDLTTNVEEALEAIDEWLALTSKHVLELKDSAHKKAVDLYTSVTCPEFKSFGDCPLEPLNELIAQHNDRTKEHAKEVETCVTTILGHLAEPLADKYQSSISRKPRLDVLSARLNTRIDYYDDIADRFKAAQTDATYMASLIDEDVRLVFGRSDLVIKPSPDHTGYVISRHGEAARFLSEGERKIIALSYFVRSLEADDLDRSRILAVIDDPVSSLDRENMYAAFAWLQEKLADLPQTIILTHDFELLRLYITATSNQRKDAKKAIARGDVQEEWFPRISFLEAGRSTNETDLKKPIQLRPFPEFLLAHSSEYHYLFHKVVSTARSDGDDSLLPLVGNASRRLLEGFATFEAPAGTSFQEKIDTSCKDKVSAELKNRVVKFAHGQSHRENPNPTTGVDLPSVRSELRALLDLIKGCNGQHFERMCKATKLAPDW